MWPTTRGSPDKGQRRCSWSHLRGKRRVIHLLQPDSRASHLCPILTAGLTRLPRVLWCPELPLIPGVPDRTEGRAWSQCIEPDQGIEPCPRPYQGRVLPLAPIRHFGSRWVCRGLSEPILNQVEEYPPSRAMRGSGSFVPTRGVEPRAPGLGGPAVCPRRGGGGGRRSPRLAIVRASAISSAQPAQQFSHGGPRTLRMSLSASRACSPLTLFSHRFMCLHEESNLGIRFFRPVLCQLSYTGVRTANLYRAPRHAPRVHQRINAPDVSSPPFVEPHLGVEPSLPDYKTGAAPCNAAGGRARSPRP